jgi:hypothetical protein
VRFSPAPDLPDAVRGRQLVLVEAAILGDQDTADRLLRNLRALWAELDTFATAPPMALSRLHMDPEQPLPVAGDHALKAGLQIRARCSHPTSTSDWSLSRPRSTRRHVPRQPPDRFGMHRTAAGTHRQWHPGRRRAALITGFHEEGLMGTVRSRDWPRQRSRPARTAP